MHTNLQREHPILVTFSALYISSTWPQWWRRLRFAPQEDSWYSFLSEVEPISGTFYRRETIGVSHTKKAWMWSASGVRNGTGLSCKITVANSLVYQYYLKEDSKKKSIEEMLLSCSFLEICVISLRQFQLKSHEGELFFLSLQMVRYLWNTE
jgi:hypothetical protein